MPVERIDKILAEIPDAKVCTPIIGKFSSGKSALVNTLLGYSRRMFMEDIPPQKPQSQLRLCIAIWDLSLYIIKNGGQQDIEIEEYRETELDATQITLIRLG